MTEEFTKEKIDRFLLRLVKRLKAHDDRVDAKIESVDVDYFFVDVDDVIFDFLGLPAEVQNFCRDRVHMDLTHAKTDAEILEVFDMCRELSARGESEGWAPPEGRSAFDEFNWADPPPFEREVDAAIEAGVQLSHGMNRADVKKAINEAKRWKPPQSIRSNEPNTGGRIGRGFFGNN